MLLEYYKNTGGAPPVEVLQYLGAEGAGPMPPLPGNLSSLTMSFDPAVCEAAISTAETYFYGAFAETSTGGAPALNTGNVSMVPNVPPGLEQMFSLGSVPIEAAADGYVLFLGYTGQVQPPLLGSWLSAGPGGAIGAYVVIDRTTWQVTNWDMYLRGNLYLGVGAAFGSGVEFGGANAVGTFLGSSTSYYGDLTPGAGIGNVNINPGGGVSYSVPYTGPQFGGAWGTDYGYTASFTNAYSAWSAFGSQ